MGKGDRKTVKGKRSNHKRKKRTPYKFGFNIIGSNDTSNTKRNNMGISTTTHSPSSKIENDSKGMIEVAHSYSIIGYNPNKLKRCYNCGILMNPPGTHPKETSQTKEHIPAKNLYTGYPEEYLANRITVPGCYKCNHEYSLIDDEMRDLIGMMNEEDVLQEAITKKAISNIIQKKDLPDRLLPNREMLFKYEPFIRYNEKNFKGVFYKLFGYPFPSDKYGIHTIIVDNGDEIDRSHMDQYGNILYNEIIKNSTWIHSGHPDIFEYLIKGVDVDPNDKNKINFSENIENSTFIMCICKYHKKFSMITMAFDKIQFNIPK